MLRSISCLLVPFPQRFGSYDLKRYINMILIIIIIIIIIISVCVIISLHTEDRAFYGYGSYRTPIEKPTDSVTVRLPVVVESDESISFHRQQVISC